MQARLGPALVRRFFHGSISRRNPDRLPGLSAKASPLTPQTPQTPHTPQPPVASRAAEPQRRHTSDTVSIMDPASAGYSGHLPLRAPIFNPLAANFSPTDQNQQQPAYALPLGQANALQPAPSLAQRPPVADPTAPQPRANTRLRPPKGPRQRDAISQPSPESGGVPDPTPEYLAIASHPPFLLPQPRNLLVVFDLNGTLLHRPSHHNPTRFIERPYAQAFLSYCINTFTVAIWSSARSQNVQNMCAQLLKAEDRPKVVAIWGRDSFGLTKADFNSRVQCYKRLTMLWNDPAIKASHPMAGTSEGWNQLNTVLVDDSAAKARSEPFNLLQIPEFLGNAQEPGFVLPQVHDYLNQCSQQTNVSAYIKSQPFKVAPDFTI
ncbi:putative phosphoprotein phosphatase [Rosellinia necatrix]|uniref:Mitochondrial import inner membrane translocase subunit TIM50 n=1 Tax=Rosellinia necatrix TaxID=77044 RepID=A0A1S7ULC3_ROSNE|nr:putative phosphoprotein phosphatase [Rosellinia necatrix]